MSAVYSIVHLKRFFREYGISLKLLNGFKIGLGWRYILGLGLFSGEIFLARGPYTNDHIWRAYPKIRDFAKYENRWGVFDNYVEI